MPAFAEASEAMRASTTKVVSEGSSEQSRPLHLRTLLYGANVDRSAKAAARLGLIILVFATAYVVIAVRLILFGIMPQEHPALRPIPQDRQPQHARMLWTAIAKFSRWTY